MSDDVQRSLGAHDANIEHLTERMASMERKLDELVAVLHEFRGGKRAMLWVAGTLGALLAIVGKWLLGMVGGDR